MPVPGRTAVPGPVGLAVRPRRVGATKPRPPVGPGVTDASDDATLSDFADRTSDDADAAPDDSPGSLESDADATPLSTYAWGDYECDRCGEGSDRVWRDDGRLVCPDCKEW